MFKLAVLTVLVALVYGDLRSQDDVLGSALNNPQELAKMFDEFQKEHRVAGYSAFERSERMKEFRKHLEEIHHHNTGGYGWREGVNFFADMSDDERHAYLGLNVSNVERNVQPIVKGVSVPARVSWISDHGAVTAVKNQGSCGSCWAFGGLGTLEGVYKQTSGVLRHFSEQQILDCTYEHNGCGGGWMKDAILGVRDISGNELASTADYPYQAYDGTCKQRGNAMVGARVSSYVELPTGEENTIAALAERPLTVTICVINSFFAYTTGIYRDDTVTSFPNHALTAVAYTPTYILVKNSWGQSWGDRGFIKVARNYEGCSFHTFVGYAVLEPSGRADTNSPDPVTDYTPGDDGEDGDCVDYFSGCREKYCHYTLIKEQCAKTCTDCDDDDDAGDCPSGTVRCSDGICRHEHMC